MPEKQPTGEDSAPGRSASDGPEPTSSQQTFDQELHQRNVALAAYAAQRAEQALQAPLAGLPGAPGAAQQPSRTPAELEAVEVLLNMPHQPRDFGRPAPSAGQFLPPAGSTDTANRSAGTDAGSGPYGPVRQATAQQGPKGPSR